MNAMKHVKAFDDFLKAIESEREEYINEVADWDDPDLIKKDRDTISCDEDEMYEREPIRRAIKKLYPIFTIEQINEAIQSCCEKDGQSRLREEFYKCVISELFGKL